MRYSFLILCFVAMACRSHVPLAREDGGATELDGGGVCCPIHPVLECSPGIPGVPGGGWAPSAAECDYLATGFDGPPWIRVNDAHGCPTWVEDRTATWCGTVTDAGVDSGLAEHDAGSCGSEGDNCLAVACCEGLVCVATSPIGSTCERPLNRGDVCNPEASACGAPDACCYPCGIPDCDYVCEERCAEGSPGCFDGCMLRP
jgi:hypothetical protein